jgi:general transcriptional corepressor CYC8
MQQKQSLATSFQKLATANEQTWLHIGSLSETLGDLDKAMHAYEAALRHNPYSVPALTQLAAACRSKEQYGKVQFMLGQILGC